METCLNSSFLKSISYMHRRSISILKEDLCKMVVCQPQPPEPQEPELQPPPPLMGLTEVIPKPDLGPASTKSTVIPPQVVIRLPSTRNLRESFS